MKSKCLPSFGLLLPPFEEAQSSLLWDESPQGERTVIPAVPSTQQGFQLEVNQKNPPTQPTYLWETINHCCSRSLGFGYFVMQQKKSGIYMKKVKNAVSSQLISVLEDSEKEENQKGEDRMGKRKGLAGQQIKELKKGLYLAGEVRSQEWL